MGTTAVLQVPVEQVTLDARFVAETIAKLFEVEKRLLELNEHDETPTSQDIYTAAHNLYSAAFGPIDYGPDDDGNGDPIGLWRQLEELAWMRAKGEIDA